MKQGDLKNSSVEVCLLKLGLKELHFIKKKKQRIFYTVQRLNFTASNLHYLLMSIFSKL